MLKTIDCFRDKYSFLSNFHSCNVLMYDGLMYPSSEHAFQAHKTKDLSIRASFLKLTAGQAKRLGKEIQLRSDWDEIKDFVMFTTVYEKFKQNNDLRAMLLDTKNHNLVEGNDWGDTYWGVCDGVGRNQLGLTLMLVRSFFIVNRDCFV